MLRDGRTVPSGESLETDLCIIGAGAAGITIAREFAGSEARVLLLESGGEELEAQTQNLYEGENVGLPYFPLDVCRLRYFGGATNHWTGYSRPFGELDFARRSWVPDSGWPFPAETLDAPYARAHELLELGPFGFGAEPWATISGNPPIALGPDVFGSELFQLSPPTRFASSYGPALRDADNLTTLLYSNVTEIVLDPSGQRVDSLSVATLAGNRFAVKARAVVLATGGIENPRLLLASRSERSPKGVGNTHDLVGRYFMEHPHVSIATFLPSDPALDGRFYDLRATENGRYWGTLTLRDSILARDRLCGVSIGLVSEALRSEEFVAATNSPGRASLDELLSAWKTGEFPDEFGTHVWRVISNLDDVTTSLSASAAEPLAEGAMFLVWLRCEQAPNSNSRVTLGDRLDPLGTPRVRLDWQLTELDYRTLEAAHQLLAAELGRAGLGRLYLPGGEEPRDWDELITGGNHHIGTTRMHADPTRGVVDAECRVHGVDNLWIAGSSVFPTSGYANPTLTLVALALRLADALHGKLGRAVAPQLAPSSNET